MKKHVAAKFSKKNEVNYSGFFLKFMTDHQKKRDRMTELEAYVNPEFPMKVLIECGVSNRFLIDVTDATHFTQEEELNWKRMNPEYGVTTPQDSYYLLRLEAINIEDPDITDESLSALLKQVILFAGEFWHEKMTIMSN